MANEQALFTELKPELSEIANFLFDAAETFLKRQDSFLPVGAVMTNEGEVITVAAAPAGPDLTTADVVLPRLHEALRANVRQREIKAVAVVEDVKITPPGQRQTRAIKVLIEHKRGLSVAFYLPFKRHRSGKLETGEPLANAANPEIKPWPATR